MVNLQLHLCLLQNELQQQPQQRQPPIFLQCLDQLVVAQVHQVIHSQIQITQVIPQTQIQLHEALRY